MLETGGILVVMGVIFAVGAAGEGFLSLFYRRYLRDTADMERPGKKLVKLTKLRYETSYYLNGTVHNAKTMVDGMLEHYRLAGLRLWTWHHMATAAAFLCGVMGFATGGIYVVGRYIPEVKGFMPLSGMNALIYTLAGAALAAGLLFWQNLLDNRTKRSRLETNLVDYFDNEKFHQLGREIALSGRVREIAGDRGRREDPGSTVTEAAETGRAQTAATGTQDDTEEMDEADETDGKDEMDETGGVDEMDGMNEMHGRAGAPDAETEEGELSNRKNGKKKVSASAKAQAKNAAGVVTIGDIIAQGEASEASEPETAGSTARGRSGARKKATATSARARAKNVQIAQEEMEERKAGSTRKKEKASKDVIIPLNPESGAPGSRKTGSGRSGSEKTGSIVTGSGWSGSENTGSTVTGSGWPESENTGSSMTESGRSGSENTGNREVEDRPEKQIEPEVAATTVSANLYADAKAAREEELLRLLREYMGL